MKFKIGDSVIAEFSETNAEYNYGNRDMYWPFAATVVDIVDGDYIVQDGQDDCFIMSEDELKENEDN